MSDKPTIIIHGFDVTYEHNKATGKRDKETIWVNYSPAHSPMFSSNRERVDFMDPSKLKVSADDENGAKKVDFMRYRWAQIERALKAWRDGHEITVDGTPLAAWPGLNTAQAGVFRALGMATVEQIATMNDAMMGRVQLPGVRDIVAQAKAFLESSDRNETATRIADLEKKYAALAEQHAAAMALLTEQSTPKKARKQQEEAHA